MYTCIHSMYIFNVYMYTCHVYMYTFHVYNVYMYTFHVYNVYMYTWNVYMGPSIKFATLFLTNFDPLPLSHFVTHRGPPIKYVTSRNTPPKITRLQYALLNFV